MLHLLFEGFENVPWKAVSSALGVDQEDLDFSCLCPCEIEDSDAAALAGSPTAPAHLADTA
jgi:hypothetical protein